MSEGLKKHRHTYIEDTTTYGFDYARNCHYKKVKYVCIMPNCECSYNEVSYIRSNKKRKNTST